MQNTNAPARGASYEAQSRKQFPAGVHHGGFTFAHEIPAPAADVELQHVEVPVAQTKFVALVKNHSIGAGVAEVRD